nr:hypothetical protein [Tanacetum cinerariifolium]
MIVYKIHNTTLPVGTTTLPVETTYLPVGTTTLPVGTTTLPVGTTYLPVETTFLPVGTTYLPVAHTGSSSRNTSSYYVTHLTSVVDYDDEYQQDDIQTSSKDPLASVTLLLARAITQNFFNPTNNCLCTSSNTRNQAIIQGDRTLRTSSLGNTSTIQCYNCSGKGHYARNYPKPRVRNSKYFMERMLLEKQDEADTIGDDQIDSNIIFDTPNGNVNSGSVEKDTHVPDLYALEQLARNAYQEAKKQKIFAQRVKKQNMTLTSQLELYKERVRVLENINGDNNYLNEFLEAGQRAKHFNQQA